MKMENSTTLIVIDNVNNEVWITNKATAKTEIISKAEYAERIHETVYMGVVETLFEAEEQNGLPASLLDEQEDVREAYQKLIDAVTRHIMREPIRKAIASL